MDDKHLKTRNLTRSASESKRKAPLPPTSDVGGGIVRSRTISAADRSLLVRKRVDLGSEVSERRDGSSCRFRGRSVHQVVTIDQVHDSWRKVWAVVFWGTCEALPQAGARGLAVAVGIAFPNKENGFGRRINTSFAAFLFPRLEGYTSHPNHPQ